MRLLLIVAVAGCSAAPSRQLPKHAIPVPPPPASIKSDEEPFEAPPLPEQAKAPTIERYSPRDLFRPTVRRSRDEVILIEGRYRKMQTIDVAEIDFLSRCARDYVQAQPETARRPLVDALTHYVTTCDADGRVVLERPIAFDARDRKTRSDVALVGTIRPHGAGTSLRVSSCGTEGSYDRITVKAGRESWTSMRLEVRRDAYGCDLAELPYTRALGKMLRLVLEDTSLGGALVQFEGNGVELVFSEATRDEIRSVLDAIDAVTAP